MKRFYFTSCLLATLLLICCDKYLDEQPDDRLELDRLDKIQKLVGNAYNNASYSFTDWFTDMVNSNVPGQFNYEEYHRQSYAWEDVQSYIWQDSPTYFWNRSYVAIAHANQALLSLENHPIENDEEQAYADAIRSEALLTRAYHHFMLVTLFSKHYDAKTASTDLGIPYILTPETKFMVNYTRHSVEDIYKFVEEDLLEGIKLVNDSYFIGSKKFRFNKNAALAFASRFYLFKNNPDKCIEYSNALLQNQEDVYIRDNDAIYSVGGGLSALSTAYGDPRVKANLLLSETFSWYQRKYNGFALNRNEVRSLFTGPLNSSPFDDSRIRKGGIWAYPNAGAAIPRFHEYFYKETLSANSGLGYVISILFTGEEVLLNLAEAYWQKKNFIQALNTLNILAKKRYYGATYNLNQIQSYYEQATPEKGLLKVLLHERSKEFFMMGMRWFDIRRHQLPVVHNYYENNQIVNSTELSANDPRKVLQIPQTALESGMQPNPR